MDLATILYTLLIKPLVLLFEVIFVIANRGLNNPGLCIVVLSLAMNLLVLPIYRKADVIQKEERDLEEKMSATVAHIKKVFKGDERFMILQTYYRQNNYSPLYTLKSLLPVILQIPFFLAAYTFLSNLEVLKGLAFGPLKDLGAPDALITLGAVSINVLPILMTLINVISGLIYTKGLPVKTKVQTFLIAAVFLVLLYNSPSGLVFYWTLNNVFSLVKNIVADKADSTKKAAAVDTKEQKNIHTVAFFASAAFLAVLTGLYIPSGVLQVSTEEFVNTSQIFSPNDLVFQSALLAAGVFVLWGGVFYLMSGGRVRTYFAYVMLCLAFGAAVNFFVFDAKLGFMSSMLQYDKNPEYDPVGLIINLAVVAVLPAGIVFAYKKVPKIVQSVVLAGVLAVGVLSVRNCINIDEDYRIYLSYNQMHTLVNEEGYTDIVPWTLSTEGQNVYVLVLDKEVGAMLPYIFQEHPELAEQFDGFTYYSNTLTYGPYTNFGMPAVYGGYEYTPSMFNERSDMTIPEKHNEALKVMPALFAENGYNVTVVNPTYANYQWIPDTSIFDGMEGITVYNTGNYFNPFKETYNENYFAMMTRNLFCYGLFKSSPWLFQPLLYDFGRYNSVLDLTDITQLIGGTSYSDGFLYPFMSEYYALGAMPELTEIVDDDSYNFVIFTNKTPHDTMLLLEPSMEPCRHVDNSAYDEDNYWRFLYNGVQFIAEDGEQYAGYQSNAAALIQIGKWLVYLQENGVYDNTRIIIVSDHGNNLGNFEEWLTGEDLNNLDIEMFSPILMYKDFGSTGGFVMSDEFMTNADTPYLATKDIIDNPCNPYTGVPFSTDYKNGDQMVISSDEWDILKNNGYTYLPGNWYSVSNGDMTDPANWTYQGEW
ncbi:MAG: YidC/Oxa1 family membrane protein insertase [Clostridiales bacterium]|nr:YidC/Oxa1 family membrane protein insertase [Clostridiales bacterium]